MFLEVHPCSWRSLAPAVSAVRSGKEGGQVGYRWKRGWEEFEQDGKVRGPSSSAVPRGSL